jgi:tetratricopeptide (TPR) repeat protein
VEALEGIHVKGKTEPLTAYRVTDLRPRRSPFGGREERPLTPFVGRDRDLAALQELLDQAEHGHGQVVGIVAEPGVGKSRLLYEFRQSLANKRVTYLEGRCISYGSDIPYLPLLDIIHANCGITESDTPQAVGQKVHGALAEVGMDAAALAPYLLQLLGVKEGTEPLAGLTSEAIKGRTFDTLRHMSLQGSQRRPVIFVGEDLHWIDRPSEEYLASLVESLDGAAILLLTTYRPGYRPPWLDKSYATQLALHPLSQQESLSVVQSVGQRVRLAEPVAKTILDRAEGNPFFLEELTRAVLELGDTPSAVTVPDTIQGVLAARIDRLPETTKRVLQAASVFGRAFSLSPLGAIWGNTGDLGAHLAELKRLEFLYERTDAEGTAYLFKHALMQDVAYESLLTSQRRTLHAAAGQALETLHASNLEPIYDRLAYHYARAAEPRKAVEYLTRFAMKTVRGHAHEEAITACREALGHCERLPVEERDRSTVQLALLQAETLHYLGRRQEAVDLLVRHHNCLGRLHDPILTGSYHFWLGFMYSMLGDRERATQHVMEAFAAATECNDQATMGRVSVLVAMERGWAGKFREAITLGHRAVAVLEQTPDRSWLGFAHYALAYLYSAVGDVEPGLQAAARVREIADAIGDRRLQTNSASVSGLLYAQMRETDAAIAACQRALEISPDPFETAIALSFLGHAYLRAEDPSHAVRILEEAVAQANQWRSEQFRTWVAIWLGEAYLANGATEKARGLVANSLKVATEINYQLGVGMAQQTMGQIAWASGAISEVAPLLDAALATYRSMESEYFIGLVQLDLAKFNYAKGEVQTAWTHLNEARRMFTALRIPRYVDRVVQLEQEFGADRVEQP